MPPESLLYMVGQWIDTIETDNEPTQEKEDRQEDTMTSDDIEFSVFTKLPAEIRAMIWTMGFMSRWGRMVDVRRREALYLEVGDFDNKLI